MRNRACSCYNTCMEKYDLIRGRRKTVSMRLDKEGKITVFAPLHFPQEKIDAFVTKNVGWIIRKRNELATRMPIPVLSYKNGERIPFFGKEYVLRLQKEKNVKTANGEIFLPAAAPAAALKRYYIKRLKAEIMFLLEKYSHKTGFVPTHLSITSARTRWGSCSGKNALSFSFRLAMCCPSAIEYVVIHELCHIRYKNHSSKFWKEVEKYCPDYKEIKKYLKEKSYFMEII